MSIYSGFLKKFKGKTGGEKGFTLLEVMIALAILAGVVVTVLASLNYHLGVAAYNRDLVLAGVLGREKAEEAAVFGLPQSTKGDFEGVLKRFSWSIQTGDTEIEGLKRIGIKVRWEVNKDISFASYVRKK